MRPPITIFFFLLITSLVNALALVITPNNVNDKRQLDIPSSILLAAEKSASALAAAYVSSLNSKLNAKTVTVPEETLQMPVPAGPTPRPPVPPSPATPNEIPLPTTTSPSSPSSTVYAWTSYVTVATVTTYVWTGTGTPTGWPFETTAAAPPPLGPSENAAPAMLVSGVFTGMVAVIFSVIVLLIV